MKAKRKKIIVQCIYREFQAGREQTALVFGDYGYHRRIISVDLETEEVKPSDYYTVTHIPSGFRASQKMTLSCTEARTLAYELSKLPVKWDGQGGIPDDFRQAVAEANNKI